MCTQADVGCLGASFPHHCALCPHPPPTHPRHTDPHVHPPPTPDLDGIVLKVLLRRLVQHHLARAPHALEVVRKGSGHLAQGGGGPGIGRCVGD